MINFYKTKSWKLKRDSVLRRDKYMCQHCKRYGRRVDAQTVHHKLLLTEHPERALDSSNLISLCYACHNKAHPEKFTPLPKKKNLRFVGTGEGKVISNRARF